MRSLRLVMPVVVLVARCGSSSAPQAGGDVRAAAARAFVECAESRGAGVAELEMGDQGVELLLYTSETPEDLNDPVARDCEEVAVAVLMGAHRDDAPSEATPSVPRSRRESPAWVERPVLTLATGT